MKGEIIYVVQIEQPYEEEGVIGLVMDLGDIGDVLNDWFFDWEITRMVDVDQFKRYYITADGDKYTLWISPEKIH